MCINSWVKQGDKNALFIFRYRTMINHDFDVLMIERNNGGLAL